MDSSDLEPDASAPGSRMSSADVFSDAVRRGLEYVSASVSGALGNLGGKESSSTNVHLQGAYAPVREEVHEINCELLEGVLPESLTGAYLRNGPNAALEPEGGYHVFDGDGMVHAVRLRDGKVSFSNRYVRTKRLDMELSQGRAMFIKLGDCHGVSGLGRVLLEKVLKSLNILPPSTGEYHAANVSIVYHAKKVLALGEVGVPYGMRMLCSGIVETLGAVTTNIQGSTSFTAHPKIDPDNGEMVAFGYALDHKPYVRVGFLDADGNPAKTVEVLGVSQPVMIHDMALTKNHVLVFDMPMRFEPERMLKENKLPFFLHDDIPGRFGLLRRDAVDDADMEWFEVPGGFFVMHEANAWEDEEAKKVHLIAFKHTGLDLNVFLKAGDTDRSELSHWTFDLDGKEVTCQSLINAEGQYGEFPVINEKYRSKKIRYVWIGLTDHIEGAHPFGRVGKVNVDAGLLNTDEGLEAVIHLPPGLSCGEMRFVPRHDDPSMCEGEDDGFLIGYVHENDESGAYFVAYDAKSMSSNMLCKFRMPTRIPFGFHGYHLTETEFRAQLS
ncbi:hypothetical protein NDN08_007042 [Rhodosorus marinus]|uniref:Uncharacterized protein n=1 Tax=Rhodosorus marinus TaxID=101924 RepID=A0AAV8UJG6_9RHOD|nr:hypothetical protein NDN08_007042 [Rhodosorus marinus]